MADTFDIFAADERITVLLEFDRFRSLRIAVRPEGLVRVRAPFGLARSTVQTRVQAKALWIARHLARFREREPARRPAFVQGEAHAYLGREYALEIRQASRQQPRQPVALVDGRMEMTLTRPPDPARVRRVLETWYLEQAREVFTRVIRELLPRFDALGVPRPKLLKVRAMTTRWGTCSRVGVITLNRRLVEAPLACVEYVAAHELCHLRHHGHDARFYGLLALVLPDWKARRDALRHAPIL